MLTAGGIKYRVCAHRGLSGLMPENTLPAFAAAISLGVDEIEFDVRLSKDGRLIVSHDANVDRISDRRGYVSEYNLDALLAMNAGSYMNWYVGYCTPEQVIKAFGGRVTMNIHINETGADGYAVTELRRLLYRYNAADSAYLSARGDELADCLKYAPDLPRCSLEPFGSGDIIDYAVRYACARVQFFKPYFNKAQVVRAHNYGFSCNAYWADDSYETRRLLDMGVDTILSHRPDVLATLRPDSR